LLQEDALGLKGEKKRSQPVTGGVLLKKRGNWMILYIFLMIEKLGKKAGFRRFRLQGLGGR